MGKDLIEMAEWKVYQEMRLLEHSVELLNRNYRELHKLLVRLTVPTFDPELHALANKWKMNLALREVGFLVHNYVAAAKSLIDHARRINRKLYPGKRYAEYQQEITRRFIGNPLCSFVEELREYAQHYRVPNIAVQMEVRQIEAGRGGTFECRLLLVTKDLRRFDRWSPAARRFLKEAGESVDLRQTIEEYHAYVQDFYRWLYQEHRRIHATAINTLAKAQRENYEEYIPTLIQSMDEYIEAMRSGEQRDIRDAFYPLILDDDRRHLWRYESDPAQWAEKAMARIESRISVPAELAERFAALTRALAPPSDSP